MKALELEALHDAYAKSFGQMFDILVSGKNTPAAIDRFNQGLAIHREAFATVKAIIDKG